MVNKTKPVINKLCNENPRLFSTLLSGCQGWNLLTEIRNEILNAGISEGVYTLMETSIVKGNFDVIYLDDRVVGADPKRMKAKRRLEQIRSTCFRLKNEGWTSAAILTESCW